MILATALRAKHATAETCNVIWDVMVSRVFCRLATETWIAFSKEFQDIWNFPHCIGAIDGRHVVVQAFCGAWSQYDNDKASDSIVLLAVSDARYTFLTVDIGAPRRCSDGGILKAPSLGKRLEEATIGIPPPQPLPEMSNCKSLQLAARHYVSPQLIDSEDMCGKSSPGSGELK
ncbi:hypothetical protein PR048_020712 [Dryococelus australis]|uniref:DDE Tnp4 domain-containing protein n=1 Tax=Dryococelus australis TaxID=614101 RepID=A0ABQ9H719_9NEOP|nr:hypothetical protein PR048_020712 [Dryococelus australis]